MKLKKPKFWDYKKPNFISYLLFPLTIPIIINNLFLKLITVKKNKKIKSICVGNIYLGGTGKTPTTIRLYEILNELKFNVSTGKKFYESQADESIILQKKTKLINGKSRRDIIEKALKDSKEIVIFDDGLQDKSISYDLRFVCFDDEKFIGNGCLLPSGPLREKIDSLKKYDGVFIKTNTRVSDINLNLIRTQNPDIKIFETHYEITNLQNFNKENKYLIFSGVGNPESFKRILLSNKLNIIEEVIFPDHHNYTKNEIETLIKKANNMNAKIITTEKDFVKVSKINSKNINFLDIRLVIKDEDNLKKLIKNKLYE